MNSAKKKGRKPAISGIVIPVQWDANGKVVTVTINTNDEKVFQVEHTWTSSIKKWKSPEKSGNVLTGRQA